MFFHEWKVQKNSIHLKLTSFVILYISLSSLLIHLKHASFLNKSMNFYNPPQKKNYTVSKLLNGTVEGFSNVFVSRTPFDINNLLKVPPDISSKYFNNLMAHLYV